MSTFENLSSVDAGLPEASWATVRRDLEILGNDIARLGEKSLTEGQEKVSEELNRLKGNVTDISRRVGRKGQASAATIASMVRERPLTSLAGAFAVGVVLATLTRSRR